MDFKVIISNAGDEKVFSSLSSEVERRLPNSAVEWKRSYGRPSKNVVLQANFSKFDVIQINGQCVANIQARPLLHIFWTDCIQNDKYRGTVKGQISRWHQTLRENNCSDWLIIHVLNQENLRSGKSKLQLPRSSVYDKIKVDFGQKDQERCVQLWEPTKETLFTRSVESWQTLLNLLKVLLLQSFGQYLDSFEDKIRLAREKYSSPDWLFVDYFVAHEDLALIYQSITLKEEALIQYNEVNALFSQFLINSKGKDLPTWLKTFAKPPTNWDGVSLLGSQVSDQYKQLIINGEASLLDFRNYLFSRQCRLLFKMKKKWEVPSLLLEFLCTTVHEISILQVAINPVMTACWIVLTCLQVLQLLDYAAENKDRAYFSTMARLYDYKFEKLKLIGQRTGLYFNHSQTEEERQLINIVLKGVGKYPSKNNTSEALISALKSPDAFRQLLVNTCNQCMRLYTEVNYKHFAVRNGIELAHFYIEHESFSEAEPLLEVAWSIYRKQNWQTLYCSVLEPLVVCQKSKHENLLITLLYLSCAKCIDAEKKSLYTQEFIRLVNDTTIKLPTVEKAPLLEIISVDVMLTKQKGHIGDVVVIQIKLNFGLLEMLTCNKANLKLKYFDLSNPDCFADIVSPKRKLFEKTDSKMDITIEETKKEEKPVAKEPLTPGSLLKRIKSHKRTWSRNRNEPTEGITIIRNDNFSHSPSSESLPVAIPAHLDDSQMTKSHSAQELSTSAGEHPIAKRHLFSNEEAITSSKPVVENGYKEDSSGSSPCTSRIENEKKEVISGIVEMDLNDLSILPNLNCINFSKQIDFEGRFCVEEVSFQFGEVTFRELLKGLSHSFFMVSDPPKLTWNQGYLIDYLLTGIRQRLHITLLNGPGTIPTGSQLKITSPSNLQFFAVDKSPIEIYPLERDGKPRPEFISIELENGTGVLVLPHCTPYERINIYFDVLALIQAQGNPMIQHEVSFKCEWLKDLVNCELHLECIFYEPFRLQYDTFHVDEQCFVKVCVCGVNPVELSFESPKLTSRQADFTLLSSQQNIVLFGDEENTLLWKCNEKIEDQKLECLLEFSFKSSKYSSSSNEFSRKIELVTYKPLFKTKLNYVGQTIVKSTPVSMEITITSCSDSVLDNLFLLNDPLDSVWRSPDSKPVPLVFNTNRTVVATVTVVTDHDGLITLPRFSIAQQFKVTPEGEEVSFDTLSCYDAREVSHLSAATLVISHQSPVTFI